jgi:hypothetical protein
MENGHSLRPEELGGNSRGESRARRNLRIVAGCDERIKCVYEEATASRCVVRHLPLQNWFLVIVLDLFCRLQDSRF